MNLALESPSLSLPLAFSWQAYHVLISYPKFFESKRNRFSHFMLLVRRHFTKENASVSMRINPTISKTGLRLVQQIFHRKALEPMGELLFLLCDTQSTRVLTDQTQTQKKYASKCIDVIPPVSKFHFITNCFSTCLLWKWEDASFSRGNSILVVVCYAAIPQKTVTSTLIKEIHHNNV